MPGGDRTGPLGLGPMTGRGLGYCSGSPTPGYMNGPRGVGYGGYGRGLGRGYGRGAYGGRGLARGRGGVWGVPYYPPVQPPIMPMTPAPITPLTKEERLQALEQQKKQLNDYLAQLNQEITKIQED